jgi:hypothetical protein
MTEPWDETLHLHWIGADQNRLVVFLEQGDFQLVLLVSLLPGYVQDYRQCHVYRLVGCQHMRPTGPEDIELAVCLRGRIAQQHSGVQSTTPLRWNFIASCL